MSLTRRVARGQSATWKAFPKPSSGKEGLWRPSTPTERDRGSRVSLPAPPAAQEASSQKGTSPSGASSTAWLWAALLLQQSLTCPPDPPEAAPEGPPPPLPQTQPEIFLRHFTQLSRPEPAPQPFRQHLLKLQDRPGSLGTETSLSTSPRSQSGSTVVCECAHTHLHIHTKCAHTSTCTHKCMHTYTRKHTH